MRHLTRTDRSLLGAVVESGGHGEFETLWETVTNDLRLDPMASLWAGRSKARLKEAGLIRELNDDWIALNLERLADG